MMLPHGHGESFEYLQLVFIIHPLVFTALIPVHTRVLFDILQEAYRVKTNDRSKLRSNPARADFPNLATTSSNPTPSSPKTTTKKVKSHPITHPSETTETEHVTQADGIQQENIFPTHQYFNKL